jgi:uncharacterized protein (DUF433 family)
LGACPLLTDGHCGLVEDAHVIVHALDPANATHREVLAAVVETCPGTPVVVDTRTAHDHEIDLTRGDIRLVDYPLSRNGIIEAIEHPSQAASEDSPSTENR